MSDLSARLNGLSEKERAALLELLRRRKGGAPASAAETRSAPEAPVATNGAWEDGGTAPASFAQERLWLIDQLLPGTAVYNIPGAFRLRGPLDVPAFARAVSEIVRRQASLRTVFDAEAGRPIQRILPRAPFALPLVDLSSLADEAREGEVLRRAAAEAERPFDLRRGPLFRIALLILGPREHVVLYTMHHIVSDGWSMSVFYREVAALYEAFAAGRPSPLRELPCQMPDVAIRQRDHLGEERLAADLAWWKERLAGLGPLELPTDRPRPAVRSGRGTSRSAVWPAELPARLTAWARGENATFYMVLLASFQALLHRLTGQDDVAVGSPVANRTASDVESLIGFFVNTLVLRTGLAGDPPFRELLARVRVTALEAFRHQEAPFEKVVEAVQPERQLARAPLFQVLLTPETGETGVLRLPGLVLEPVAAPTSSAKLDLSLSAGESPQGFEAHLEIDADLFEAATADRLLRHLRSLFEGVANAPETRLSQLPLLAPAEREQLLAGWNRTAVPIPREPVHRLFEEQVDRAPEALAVSAEGTDLTYAELDAAANRLAHRLRRLGAGPEVPVVVLAERSPALVAALLAVMKSGGFFVPLDPAHPRERLAAVIARTGARLAVTEERFLGLLPEGIESVCLDRDRAIATEPAGRIEGGAGPRSLLYVMFTSGSTGEPKGVTVTHGNVVRLVKGTEFAAMGPGETFLLLAPVSFDASTLELWGPLANGGRLAVAPPHPPSLDELVALLERFRVTQLWLTAGLFHQMVDERPQAFAGLRRLLAGGDALSPDHVRRVLAAHPGLTLVNGYGPTESTTFATCHALTAGDPVGDPVPIGQPIANTTVHVLEPGLEPAPLGVWGELWIGGEGLARGYFGRPDLTAERFVPDPFGAGRLYRTGDRGRRRPDGTLEILGRLDRQVKIRGFRIEPAEIEAVLAAHPEVAEAAVLVRVDGAEKRLVAYVAPGGSDLRAWLAARLPEPMVPEAFVVLGRLPLTPNGKVDRRALAAIAPERAAAAEHVPPRTPTEKKLAGLWIEVLGDERTGERTGIHDHFFELGGHSLLATRLLAAIRDAFGVELPLRVVFERPTLAEVARAIDEQGESGRGEEGEEDDRGPAPLSFSQERLWLVDQIAPGTAAYNIPGAFRMRGALDVGALGRAVAEIVRRHEALRTTFVVEAGGPVQRVAPFDPASPVARLPLLDLSALPAEERPRELEARMRAEAGRPFDLAAGPLFRAALVRLGPGPEEHVALYTLHHAVSDGWSMGVFFREMGALYQAFAAGRPSPLPPLPLQVADHARRQRRRVAGEAMERGLAAWRRILEGVEPLELPTDRPRPAARTWRGAAVPFALDAGVSARLADLAGSGQATPYMALLGLFQTFLHRLSRQDDVAVGSPVANRRERDLDGLIGFFVNSVTLRGDLSGDPPFREVLRRARHAALEAFQLQEIPFEKVVEAVQPERHTSRTPLFQVMMTLQAEPPSGAPWPGLALEPLEPARATAKYDLSLEVDATPEGLAGLLEFDLDLFDPATAARWSRHLATLIESAVAAPDLPVSRLFLLTPPERAEIVLTGNRTAVPIPRGLPVHRLVEEQADRAPDAVALTAETEELTYAELGAAANRLAHRLRRLGAGPEVPVVVLAERSPGLIVALLAVMKSGGFFVPLDPAHPRERLASILARMNARLAVTEERFLDRMPDGIESVCLDRDRGAIDAELSSRLEGGAGPQSLLYVMFTSGSTGEPKGVAVTHGNVVRLVRQAPSDRFRGTAFADLGPGETVLMVAPAAFDASTFELWGPLANGGRIAVFPPHTPGLDELAEFLERRGVTQAFLTTALFHQMAERRPDAFTPLRRLLVGGEVVSPALARRVIEELPGLRLSEVYGPTESTTFATAWPLTLEEASRPSLSIGLPIANTTAHVLEPSLEPAPVGVWGELYVGGEGVARGYFGRPDLTAERFVPDPFGGGRLYRTGDLARRRPDGALEFLGRADRQVKIRGFRVEPAEVEAALLAHPEVAEAAVLVRGEGSDRRLVAYVAPGGSDLRAWLAGRLPEPMVPAAFVVLDRLPLTPNGKVNRRALAAIAPERGDAAEHVPPRTPTELALADLWLEILGPERTGGRVGVHDHFFALGGHSLLATRLIASIRDVLGVELPVRVLFERPTLAEVARAIEEGEASGREEHVEDSGPAPLSFSQERLWLVDRIAPGTAAYNVPGAFRMRGRLDVGALLRAVAEIVRRHDVLRTTFAVEAGGPVQRVAPFDPSVAWLPWVDLAALPEARREGEAQRWLRLEAARPFDLAVGPLFRAVRLRLGPEEHVALYTMHHAVSDGWSLGVFFREMGTLYGAFAAGRPSPLPPLPLQYADHARRQRRRLAGEAMERGLAAWRRILDGVEPLELPTDRPRPATRSWRGAAVPFSLGADLSVRLAEVAGSGQATPYMALLALFQTFLHRLSGQDDVAVGSPVANRRERDLEGLIGFFVNSVVLRGDLSGDPPFREVLRRARQAAVEAFQLQEIPFEKVVEALQPERHTSRTPLFQVILTLESEPPSGAPWPGLALEPLEPPHDTVKFDLGLELDATAAGLTGDLEFDLDLFDPATAVRWARHLRTLIEAAVASPDLPVSRLPLLTPAEREEIVVAWNRTAVPIPRDRPVHRLFEEQVDRAPEALAVIAAGLELTYAELDAAANRLAHRLRRLGAGPEVPVLVLAERSPGLIAALLAVMKSGAFFVPLDPAHPRERLATLITRSGARLAVTQERFLDLLPDGIESICLDRDRSALAAELSSRLEGGATAQSLAYVMFTSGSTGEPKGVAVTHGNVVRLVRQAPSDRFRGTDVADLGPGETMLVLATVAFDASTFEIWGPLVNGGRIAVFPPHTPGLDELAEFLERRGVTQAFLTTALFHQMAERRPEAFATLRRLLTGGDVVMPALARRVIEALPGLRLSDLYGPTESTTIATAWPLTLEEASRPTLAIGLPIANTTVHVLDRWLEPLPLGVWGELCIGGEGLARGYLGRPDLTAERFVPDPFGGPGDRLYRSGDLARRRPDGVLEFLGRLDRQVKIRGFRIEPAEIEAALVAHPEVAEAAVLVRGEGSDKHLVAYVAPGGTDLRAWLAARLPEPMVPAAVVVLDRLPLTPNAKVDRRALAKIAPERTAGDEYVAPRTPTEQTLAGLWLEVLGEERTGGRVGVYDHFFGLGGHSLLATRLVAAIRDVFGVELPLRVVFERPTLEGIARAVEESGRGEVREDTAEEDGGPAPLSFSQERLWLLEQIDPGTAAYNVPGAIRLHGRLDVAALGRAVAEIVRRHDALRTAFAIEEERAVQLVEPFDPERPVARLPLIDLAGLPAGARSSEAGRLRTGEALRPFDLAAGPLFRAALVRLGAAEHVAFYTMHHIVSDGWSMGVFYREVGLLYAAFAAGRPSPLPPLPLQYADFARRQRRRLVGALLEDGIAAWRRLLDGVPPLELPTDRPRPMTRSWRGAELRIRLQPDLSERLSALGRDEQATLYIALLALFQTFLHRFARQDDVAVGTAVANRTDRDVGALIGFFVNSLAMRTSLAGDPPFREVLRRARRTALEAFGLQEIPFEKVVEAVQPERHASRTPLFQVMLTLQNTPPGNESLAGLDLEPVEAPGGTAKFDLTLAWNETARGLSGALEYDLDLFDAATAERMARHLVTLAEAAVAAPERRISEIPLLAPLEREQIVLAWNRTAVRIPRGLPVHRLFEEQVDRAPDAVAVTAEGEEMTYAQLDAAANRLAHRLRRLGAGPEVPVVVLAERSPELIAALLAVMKSGGFFVPLDPAHPRERLAPLLARIGARLAVTRERFLDLLPDGVEGVCLDRDRDALAAEPASRLDRGAAVGNLLYVMFTSGSTGEPKGVAVTHGNVVRLVKGTGFAGLGPGETFLMLAPVSFDASTLELWGPLANGGRIAVVPPHTPSLDELAAFLARQGVTQLWLTAGLFHQMADERPEAFAGLRRLLAGGDVLSPDHVRRALAAHPGLVLVNGYGPTESTTFATCHELTAPEQVGLTVPIGKPIANTTVHVLEPNLEPAPVGVWGELCLGGEGLARGYLGRPDLTAERFVPHPFATLQGVLGGRVYHTGDLARRRPDGTLEILGRIDRQVKIRGFRIEPAEIEAVLLGHPEVAEAAVLVRGEGAEKRLVAYVAPGGEEIRPWLATRLPEPMIPSAFVVLPRLPLTPNGKVDRKELAKITPERSAGDGYVAPRTPTEETLAGLWVEVLGEERTGGRVGVCDNFFELGGHSLLATRLMAAVRDVFQVELPLRVLFERPTLEEVARAIEEARPVEALALFGEDAGPAPLSFSQERLWFIDQMAPGTAAYNVPGAFRLRGSLDAAALGSAIAGIVRRHDALRTTFAVAAEQPLQVVEPFDPERPVARVPWIDLSALAGPLGGVEADRLARAEALRPFDLAAGPLFRATLVRLGPAEHVALYTMHHIVSDGWSMGVFFREVATLYAAFAAGRPSPLPPLPLQYAGYARRQRRWLAGPRLESGLDAWRRILAGVAPLELPTDRPRPATRSWRGSSLPVALDPELSARLSAIAAGERATLYMVLLALFQTFLHRMSGQDDVAVGTAVANRTERDVEGLIGFFVNSVVLRTGLAGDPPFQEIVQRARRTALEAFQLQEIPFEKIVEAVQPERHTSRAPLFQVMLTLLNTPQEETALGELVLEPVDAPIESAKLDLTLALSETPEGLSGGLEFDLDLFDPATAARMARHLTTLIGEAVAAPERRISEIPLLTPPERDEIVLAWNRTAVPIPRDLPVHRLFEEQVDRAPEAVAISAEGEELTYARLDALANRLAHRLRRLGAGPEVPVVVLAERSPELIAALLAVMKSGAFFVPLDPAFPRDRLASVISRAGARLAVTRERHLDRLPDGVESVCLDRDREAVAAELSTRLDGGAAPGNLLYVMFTSGSTGEPKGVAVTHGNVVRLVRGTNFADLGPGETFLMLSPVSFDLSTLELWGPLANGGRVAVFPPHTPSLDELGRFLERFGVTQLWLTAGLFHQMVDERPEALGLLRRLLAGGDVVSPDHARRLLAACPGLVLVDGYGPTESTTFATCHELTAPDQVGATVPIGRPIANTTVHILEPGHPPMDPAPVGVWGELCIGGEGLARGYLGRPDLTAERFVPDPTGGGRLYRSGDLARRRPDGVLEFLGRIDRQVKIRGFRVEPAEVETVLAAHPAVAEAAVLVRGAGEDKRLVAYVAGEGDGAELRRWLAGRLPEPMVPAAVVVLDRLPLTANGKVDRRALAQIAPERSAGEDYVAPRTPVEEILAGLFAEVLGAERTGGRVGVHDSFFALGGHSLAATRLVSRLRAALGVELPLRAVFEAPTLAELAARCEALAGTSAPLPPLVPRPRDPAGDPLSFAQERLWFLDRLTPGTATYNLPSGLRLLGPLDPARLARALGEVRRRHEALRTRFALRGGAPVQIVDPPSPFLLPLVDLTGLPEARRSGEAGRLAALEAELPFDLELGPLVRAVLVRLGAGEHNALLDLHHIVTDGWSMSILYGEVAALYQALTEGRPAPLPELPVQVADVARWQRETLAGPALEAQLAWWRGRLAGASQSLDLPLDRIRPAVQTFRGAEVAGGLPPELADRLRALAHREGASFFMVLLAGLCLVLGRLSGQEDVVVGSPVAGRTRPELERLIGLFLNTLVLRVDLAGAPTVRGLLASAREAALGAYAHQDVPFEKLLQDLQPERDLSRTPLFQVFLNLLSFPDAGARLPDGLVLEPLGGAGAVESKFDLTVYAADEDGGLSLSLVYNADLFDRARMEELSRQLRSVLAQIAEAPDAPLGALSLLTPEAAALLPDPRQPLGDAWIGPVHALFAEQARRRPERPAVSDDEGTWTYGELAEAVSRLAARLRADGLAPGEPVAVWAHRGAPVALAMMATAWAGGAFVMLDPAYPPERLVTILELAAPRYWLEIAAAGAPPAEVEETLRKLGLRGRVTLPGGGPAGARALVETLPAPAEPVRVGPDDLAYLAFTSGSTGTPKGIEGRHGPLSHFLPFLRERFGLTEDDRTSLLSGLSHDPLQRDVFTPLCLGAALAAPTAEDVTTPGRLAAWMAREGITIAHLTPAMAQILTETGGGPASSIPTLRWVLLVGDVLTRLDVDRLRRIAPRVTCVNLYGSTETQRSVAYHVVEEREIVDARAPQVLPLGRGMRDVQLLVVSRGADSSGAPRLAGVGEVGEIWMRSPHLARGYLGDPALTEDRFQANPFTAGGADRVYRTGDLGRYRPDGEATFAGRADQQVKIRGFRIELGEIEAALGRLPGVREAVVLLRETGSDRSLTAYVVGEGIDPERLREGLRPRLPAYMVPADVVPLDRLPVTPNGKVDRRALARIEPERTATEDAVAPRTPVEETLARLFVEVLGAERTGGRVGVHDSFFALGGHSLLATRLMAAVRDAFQVEPPLRVLFETPTVEGLARAIEEAGGAGAPVDDPVVAVPRAPGANRFPVSFSQLREWILDRLEPGNPAYNILNNLRIGGPLSVPVLTEALNRLVERHEVFRTAFEAGEEEPLQIVLPEARVEIPVIDLSALPEAAREAELARHARHHADTGFDLTVAPLLRAGVVRLGPQDHALLMTVHHIIADGWSMGILNQELAALYETAAAGGLSPLPPLPVQYADYAVWLRKRLDGMALERQAGSWKQRLTGAPPLLELPTDRPRPPVRSSRGARLPFVLPQPLTGRLEELALRHGATLFMVVLAGYQSLLARWSGQEDVVVGTYSGNRPRRELEGLIGFFINTLVLRTDLAGDPSFAELVGRVRETTLEAYAHRDVPFEKLLETLQLPRDPSRTPLFQALLVLHNFPAAQADLSTGVRLSALPVDAEKSDYDLSLWLAQGPEGLGGYLDFSTDLFEDATIVRFAAQLQSVLEAAVAEPERNVWTLPLISAEEQARQLEAWSRGPAVPEGETLLHRLIEEQAARTPEAVALEGGSVRLTYAELVDRARSLAGFLREQGIGPGSIVALAAERAPELIVRMLAVLQAGAAYLPIDPAYPAERRAFMVADSGAVLAEDSKDVKGLKDPKDFKDAESPAYVIYTSGSTGRPKGVVVPHRAIASFVRAARATYALTPADRVLQFASISFDTSAEEIWPALAAGATLVLRPDDMAASIPHFLRELERLGTTVLDLPTAFWHELVAGMEAENLSLPRGLRLVILGGEEALADRLSLWLRRVGPSVRLVNTYGPTEATIVATRRELSGLAPVGIVPIGRPIPGARAYVLDRFLEPVPPGVRGELWIGGSGVARGYLGRPDLTADRFRPDPFDAQTPGSRLYRTGDLAVLRPDGDLVFAGRADRQLKIRGYRIEPGEIEAALRLHPAVRDAVVEARGAGDARRLIAWIVQGEGIDAPGASDLRAFLRERLPEPLLPAAFAPLAALPLTPSGKVDRRRLQTLPEPADARPEDVAYAEPQSALERTIAEIYRDLLRVRRIGLHDNFFDLGGHSLLIVRAHQKLKEALGKEIPVLDLFRFPTVAALARHLGGEETGNLRRVQSLAEQQRAAQQRQRAAMERLRRPDRRLTKE